jgi:adenine-specific DNA-methyltransferase
MTLAGRVKCIYIDPPYNTGNKDFVYNDRFVDKEDLWRHSKWCEFMFQRLTLAKDLLRQDGVIFVSIDDNELHHLALLMNRIFGETNFIANIIWRRNYAPKGSAKHFSVDQDYILVFALNADSWRPHLVPRSEKQDRAYKNPDDDARGLWRPNNLAARNFYSKGTYPITCPSGRVIAGPPPGSYWRVSEERFRELDADGRIWWGKKKNNVPAPKIYLSEVKQGIVPQTFWNYDEVGHTQDAKKEIVSLFPESASLDVFSTPKPVRLIDRMLRLSTDRDSIVLDFFAGSGTTAHAVHKLNREDGGNRRVILVSSTEATVDEPGKNLCRDVCATRVRRVIEGYGDTPGLGGDFAYLRCRRIAPGKLMDIDHGQVWTALQLLHVERVTEYRDEAIVQAGDDEQLLVYVPHFKAKDVRTLKAAVESSRAVVVYSWQPELIRQRLREYAHVQVEALPESLARRFGKDFHSQTRSLL